MKYPVRKHPRLKEYDYSTPNYYFITVCTHQKKCLFGSPEKLNAFGRIALQGLEKIPGKYPDAVLDQYVVMPNHIHCILVLQGSDKNVEQIIGQYKAFVTKQIRSQKPGIEVWQTSFHDHIIRNQKAYEKIWLYIQDNPRKWEEDCFYTSEL